MAQQVEHHLGKDVFGVKTAKQKSHTQAHKKACAAMAQQVEHVLGKDEVTGPNPVSSSMKNHNILWFFSFFRRKNHKTKNVHRALLWHTVAHALFLPRKSLFGRINFFDSLNYRFCLSKSR